MKISSKMIKSANDALEKVTSKFATVNTVSRPIMEIKDKKVKIIISKQLQNQIIVAHALTDIVEWSGFLLYKENSGSLESNELTLYADYVHLLDVGTKSYTEFNTDESIIDLYEELENAMDYKVGKIHSHNDFNCFHSGVDMGCLQDNSDKYPYYVSLIVNYKGKYDCKIAWIAKQPDSEIQSTWGKWKVKGTEYLCTVNCEIEFEAEPVFITRLNTLISKRTKLNSTVTNYNTYYSNNLENVDYLKNSLKNHQFPKKKTLEEVLKEDNKGNQLSMPFDKTLTKNSGTKPNFDDVLTVSDFTAKWILQDFLFEGTLKEAVTKVHKEYKRDYNKIDLWVDIVDDSIMEYYKIVFNQDPTFEDLENLCIRIKQILTEDSVYPSIDALLDVLNTTEWTQ